MSDKTCSTCQWWTSRECRRYPPQVVARVTSDVTGSPGEYREEVETEFESVWPDTLHTDWCGEHKG